jgi:TPR repeat protein
MVGVTAAVASRGEKAAEVAPVATPAPERAVTDARSASLAETAPVLAAATSAAPAANALAPPASSLAVPVASSSALAPEPYEAGQLVPRDAARAETYRKVELTQLVRQCEKRKPAACTRLAARYAAGDGVGKDERKARQLNAHARELCARRPSEGCDSLQAP